MQHCNPINRLNQYNSALFDMFWEDSSEERDAEGGEEEVEKLVLKEFAREDSSHLNKIIIMSIKNRNGDGEGDGEYDVDDDNDVDGNVVDDDVDGNVVDDDVDPLHLLLPSFPVQAR